MDGLGGLPGAGGGQVPRVPGLPAQGGQPPPDATGPETAPAQGEPAGSTGQPGQAEEAPARPQPPGRAGDTFVPFAGTPRIPGQLAQTLTPGQVLGQAAVPGEVTGQGTAGPTSEGSATFGSLEEFPDDVRTAFEALAQAPFGTRVPGKPGATPAASAHALFKQFNVVPHEVLKKNPAAFLFLNTVLGKYPAAEIRKMAARAGIDLEKVVTHLVLETPAQPQTIARLAGQHRLGADRTAVMRQAEHMAASQDPLQQLAGRFTKTVLANNPQALQLMLTDPLTFFGTQLWAKLRANQQEFVADGTKTRKATGMLQNGALSARGLAFVIGENAERDGSDRSDQQVPLSANELQQQKAFYDQWRETLIKGIKESADAKSGRPSGPPVVEAIPISELGATRAVYDPARRTVRLGSAFPECLRMHTHGLTLTVAPDGELLEIALRNPQDRWELKKDLHPPVLAGIEPARARLVDPREGENFPTHDRFYTSDDRNVIYFQVEKRPVARRVLAAANVLLELDDKSHLLGILIWQLSAAKARPAGDQKAWIAGLAERGPTVRPS
ncbi:MAG: hypothetical protein FJZ01_06745 [Candidatus Sericytochromatia bacterium]|nr:hypothetical protein [Candidatus Tanganyikabacteria bacterium]